MVPSDLNAFRLLTFAVSDDEGGCDFEGLTNYRMGLHIGAVFILLGVSLLGAFAPMFLHFIRHPAARAGLKYVSEG